MNNPHSAFRSAPFAPAARPALNITSKRLTLLSRNREGDLHYITAKPEPTHWYESAADAGG